MTSSRSTWLWRGTRMIDEPVVLVDQGEPTAEAALLLPATTIERVTDATGQHVYHQGSDYRLSDEGRLVVPAQSPVPVVKLADLYPPAGAARAIGDHVSREYWLMHAEDDLWHRHQPRVTYRHTGWDGPVPVSAADQLPGTLAKLRQGGPIRVVLFGDSISEGYNASGFMGVSPHEPSYGERLMEMLRQQHEATVVCHNESLAGKDTRWALDEVGSVVRHEPDLVLLAWGMNDASGRCEPRVYRERIEQLISQVQRGNAEVEFVLVSTMTGNPEWSASAPELYGAYRDELRSLTGSGVVLADVYDLWQWVASRKAWIDLTGNGVNHPNDFGHRLYAEVIAATMGL